MIWLNSIALRRGVPLCGERFADAASPFSTVANAERNLDLTATGSNLRIPAGHATRFGP